MLTQIVILVKLLSRAIVFTSPTPHSPRDVIYRCEPVGNQYDAKTGTCKPCLIGSFSPDGMRCYPSPIGYYNNKPGSTHPIGCSPGTYSNITGSIKCEPCTAPLFSFDAATSCSECAEEGTTSLDGRKCVIASEKGLAIGCAPGSSTSDGGNCTLCDPGYFSPAGIECLPTPIGFYNDEAGSAEPIGCIRSSFTDTEYSISCDWCPITMMSIDFATNCIACVSGLTSSDGVTCMLESFYSILVTDIDGEELGYLSNTNELDGWVRVGLAEDATQFYPPASFAAKDMPVNLLASTLGSKSGLSNGSPGDPGFGHALSFAQNGANVMNCEYSNAFILTQSTIAHEAEFFSEENDWAGEINLAASKIWVIGEKEEKGGNERWSLTLSIYGTEGAKSPITSAYFFSSDPGLHYMDCDTDFNNTRAPYDYSKELFYLIPADSIN